jgi:hypothetical protein
MATYTPKKAGPASEAIRNAEALFETKTVAEIREVRAGVGWGWGGMPGALGPARGVRGCGAAYDGWRPAPSPSRGASAARPAAPADREQEPARHRGEEATVAAARGRLPQVRAHAARPGG